MMTASAITILVALSSAPATQPRQPPPRGKAAPPPAQPATPRTGRTPPPVNPPEPTPTRPRTTTPARAGTRPAARPASSPPEACTKAVDRAAGLLDTAIAILAAEEQKEEDAVVDVGVAAFNGWLQANRGELAAARVEAERVHATLDEAQRTLCEEYAYKTFKTSLARLSSSVQSFYRQRVGVFRRLGDLFR